MRRTLSVDPLRSPMTTATKGGPPVSELARFVSAAAVACLLSTPLVAQQPVGGGGGARRPDVTEGTVFDPHLGMERPWVKLRGDALPTYIVVETFFYDASSALERSPTSWSAFLSQLGIEAGSNADSALREATLAARESVLARGPDEPPPAWAAQPATTADDHVATKRGLVARLVKIYASLLVRLAADSYDIEQLNRYLQEDVRRGTSVTVYPEPWSTDNLDARVLAEEDKFDELLINALAAEAARGSRSGGG